MKNHGRVALVVGVLAASPALAQSGARQVAPLIPGGDSKAPISINANKLQYFDKDKKLVYSGDVMAKQGEATLKASTLTILLGDSGASNTGTGKSSTDLMPSGGSQDVRRMEAAGPVTILQKDQVGIGDNAVYDKVENKVYLIGHVSLSQGPNITKGDRLIYDLTTSQAQVEGGRVQSIFTPGSGDNGGASGKPAKAKKPVKATADRR